MDRFDVLAGERTKVHALPADVSALHPSANGDEETAANTSGRIANRGMEGLAISPNGLCLVGIMQSPLAQDGGTAAPYTRIGRQRQRLPRHGDRFLASGRDRQPESLFVFEVDPADLQAADIWL